MEGQIEIFRQQWATHGERMEIVRHKDNLKLEGKFEDRFTEKWHPADRPTVIRRKDNLKPGVGNFEKKPVYQWAPGDRAPIVKRQDNLRLDPRQ